MRLPLIIRLVQGYLRRDIDPQSRARRAELLDALRGLEPEQAYLVRAEHMVIVWMEKRMLGLRMLTVVARLPEDEMLDAAEDGGGHVIAAVFGVPPGRLPVLSITIPIQLGEDGSFQILAEHPTREQARDARKSGILRAGPEEVRELVSQIAAAEHMTDDGPED